MKKPVSLFFFCLLFMPFFWAQAPISSSLEDASLEYENANGDASSFSNEMNKNGLIVVFSCNTCPFVVGTPNFPGWERQYNELYDQAFESDIGFVLVNSNEAKRAGDDSFLNMKKHAKDAKYKMSYFLDDKSVLANALSAKTTPHVFFYDASYRLVYSGSIDNIWDGRRKKELPYLKNAIKNHLNNKKIKPNATAPKGCSIKRQKA
jgi:thioredoxin-related protein